MEHPPKKAIEYTPEQEKAIYERGKSLLLSAAAGSGKTAVLVQRIIELVCSESGPNIDKLLVVTFTKLAASEMRDRIYKEINKRIKAEPKNKKLKKQLLLLPSANIKTIHGFCLDFIKNNIHLTNIPVNFRIANETEVDILKKRCITELLEDKYEENSQAFTDLMDTYGYGRDDSTIIKIILSIHNFSVSLANPDEYFNMCINNIEEASEDFSKTIFAKIHIDRFHEILSDNKRKYETAMTEIAINPDLAPYSDVYSHEYDLIKTMLLETDFNIIQKTLLSFSFFKKPRMSAEKESQFVKTVRADFLDELKKFIAVIGILPENEMSDNKEILKYAKTIIAMCGEFKKRFENEKLKKGIIDFSDFEHMTLSILTEEDGSPSEIAHQLKNEFFEILIDEYQDTNDVQDKIFEILSKNQENLFMVGDVKQSIYKFRQARPEIFIAKKEIYEEASEKKELILLSHNFRSRNEVIDSVNAVFLDLMKKESAMTDYKEEALKFKARYETNPNSNHKTEVLIFDKSVKSDEDIDLENEAILVADSIKKILRDESFKLFDTKAQKFRSPKYSDIIILFRSFGDFGYSFYNTLLECQIPVTADFSENLCSSIEILSVIAILKAIDNPLNDIALLSLLKSPVFNFSEDEILIIRELLTTAPLYYALKKSESEKAKNTLEFLDEFKEMAYTKPLSYLVNSIYKMLKIKEIFSVFKNGEQRISNLDVFLSIAKEFEKNNYQGLKAFIIYLESSKNSDRKTASGIKKITKDAVRIMTIHKSKGLEFPIVYVSGLGKKFNRDDIKSKLIVHPDLGMGLDYIDIEKRFSNTTLTKEAFKIKIKDELLSEELRVLYVALTRAGEKLILTGSLNNFEKDSDESNIIKETGGVNKNTLLKLSSFMKFILPTVIDNRFFDIKVTTIEELPDYKKTAAETFTSDVKKFDTDNIFYEYKNINLSQIPAKITVSQVNKQNNDSVHQYINLESLDKIENEYSGSEYGTYFHKMFELLDIEKLKKGHNVHELSEKLISDDIISEYPYTTEIIEEIERFFETETGKELILSDVHYKERPFLVRIPAHDVYNTDSTYPIMLQGTADCYFVKNNEITLIDFKTDRKKDEKSLRKSYSEQIKLYAYAIEKIENKKVTKKIIYSAQNNIEILF